MIGGGITLNIAGLAASLIMRGIRFSYIPTTLTAQIDASIGSKQGVNFMGTKNWIGLYNDPEFCYINTNFVNTNSSRELRSQAIEGIKLYLATNRELFFKTKETIRSINKYSSNEIHTFIEKMIKLKISILKQDLLEENYGMSLLYGHTVGHAIEILDLKEINHGIAVGLGMLVAAHISVLLNIASPNLVKVHRDILNELNLICKIPSHINLGDIISKLKYNKKNFNGEVHFVLLKDIGEMYHNNGKFYTIVPNEVVIEAIKRCY